MERKIAKQIRLSPSRLNLFLECPFCFWLEHQGIHRPKGIFPSLPSGMDLAIKKYFDIYREKNELPPELEGKVVGKLLRNYNLLSAWRNNRKGISFFDEKTQAELFGAIDDCLVTKDDKGQFYMIPIDFKTRGFALKADSTSFYQNQLDCYALLIEKNGYRCADFAYLVYFIPLEIKKDGIVQFNIQIEKVNVNPSRALKTFREAVAVLRGTKPKRHSECTFCAWADDWMKFE